MGVLRAEDFGFAEVARARSRTGTLFVLHGGADSG